MVMVQVQLTEELEEVAERLAANMYLTSQHHH